MNIRKKNGKNMNSQRISFLSVAWLVLPLSPAPCGSCVTSLFLEGHFCIHLEVASDSFCFLINSSWLLVFILLYFSLFFSGFNLYCIAVTPWTQWMGRELTGIMFCVQGSCLNLVGGLSCDRSLVSDRQPIE